MENQKGSRAKDQSSRVQTGSRSDLPKSNDGKRKRTRSSRSEQQGSEEGHFHHEPISEGVGERVWFNRSIYEQADVAYQTLLSSGSGTPLVPPKERIPHTLVFRSKRNTGQPYQEENSMHTRCFTSRRDRQDSTHQRSSSEPKRARHVTSGSRKRVYSATECAPPRRENITMSALQGLAQEKIWFDKSRYDEAERSFYEGENGIEQTPQSQNASKSEDHSEVISRMKSLQLDNKNLHKVVDDLRAMLSKLESRMAVLEKSQGPAKKTAPVTKAAPVQKPKVAAQNGADDDDDDVDLFGSEEEDEEAERIKAERVKEYAARKSKKPALIAKSSILLDVKPWDDETEMSKLEECVRSIQMDGLLWGASKLVPVGYGIKKLQIGCVVEDDKVGTDILEEEITKFEDYVQSVDIAAFNKI
ncbi:eukaryotic translation elongation factor 1 delta a (guanine nucleotide exchange protein) isoform X4 [Triplophysa rosa]|uniref:eukaryotic translation elongation factor 1 delta a (guanine nucleotide exchange protein) isoform X4 n=1 Tax=Triplophysa rosa TaxID=992332 RepID=UPI002545C89C|nr:eukaryotic translation elongation factor 1 delta a (guanine nucleotide exchange protein) isoform X4 [Triplophysa rosa]